MWGGHGPLPLDQPTSPHPNTHTHTHTQATSALDATSEAKITDALTTLARGRTTVVVAHRLKTVRDADTIAVIEGGVVSERGTHAALVEAGGTYAALVESQLL